MKAYEFAQRRTPLVIGLILGLVTLTLYAPLLRNGFIDFDDTGYITDNPPVTQGVSRSGIIWAFHSFAQGNWHPLTWISHMIDCQFFGLNAAGHHLINVLFHTANTLLVFVLLNRITGKIWPSFFVAAFFGWHPLHVESVAWASERKDILCAFFWLLTMMAYVSYVKKPRVGIYALALAWFACALMSKPMAVTLPFVLLLFDFWPLNRLEREAPDRHDEGEGRQSSSFNTGEWWQSACYLILEKSPFFLLSLVDCWVTFIAQKSSGAVLPVNALPFSYRLANAVWSYLRYISDTLWPAGLSLIYPYKEHLPALLVGISIALLVIWSGLFLLGRSRFPYLMTGWFWFLGTLIPVIGLVQVGAQSMADRYMYIPGIGLFILIVWGVNDLTTIYPRWQNTMRLAGVTALAACLVATSIQIHYWQNSITLFTHAIEVTGDNGVAYYCLGLSYEEKGNHPAALALYEKSVAVTPDYYPAQYGLGSLLLKQGDTTEARTHFDYAEKLDPNDAKLEFDIGMILLNAEQDAEGIDHLRSAARLAANNPLYHANLGFALQKVKNTDQAIQEFSRALTLQPDYPFVRYGLASVLTTAGRTNEAMAQYKTQVKLHADDPEAHYNLGLAQLDSRQYAEAQMEFERELQLAPGEIRAEYRLAQALASQNQFAAAVAQYRAVLQQLPNFTGAKEELGVLLAAHPELK